MPERLATREANAMVDLVAVAESFCVARLATVGFTADVNTWNKRAKAWRTHHIDLANDCPTWSALMGFVEARNAIQHGMGRLTDRQLGKYKVQTLTFIASAAIRLNGDAIIVGEQDIARCDHVCTEFIRWLDEASPPPT